MDPEGGFGWLVVVGGRVVSWAGPQRPSLPQVPSQQAGAHAPERPADSPGPGAGPAQPSCLAWCENED